MLESAHEIVESMILCSGLRATGERVQIFGQSQAEEAQKLSNAELDHRVKNALATVSGARRHRGSS